MADRLRVLVVEDSDDDALLLVRELKRAGYEPVYERVDTADAMLAALKERTWDVVVADYVIPGFGAMGALAVLKESGVDVPCIVVSGKVGEDVAVDAMRAGAHDYVLKSNLTRFVPAIQREVRDANERRRAKEEVERLRHEWEEIIQLIAHPVVVLDPDFRILLLNRAATARAGVYGTDAVGRRCHEVLHGLDSPPGGCPMKRLLATASRVPVTGQVEMYGGTSLTSYTPIYDRAGRLVKVIQVATDVTEDKELEKQLRRELETSRRSLYGMVNTITTICEIKDPYTAGHQRGVSRIARAIASEMGLPQERVEGVRVAGLLHDVGKIFVPAEILSKPARLTDHERSIMRTHVQTGWEVLRGIESPWPLAEAALQHHERMDGSGYPSGLSGEGILLEARILGVADVVDAMSSHRPYRPALGVDRARDEIRENRGVLYDQAVVDACLTVLSRETFDLGGSLQQAYREAIDAVTGGRLQLVDAARLDEVAVEGELVASGEVTTPLEATRARRKVEPLLDLPPSRKRAVLACLSEALNNASKRAGGGRWEVRETPAGVRVVVDDSGPGMSLTELSRATLTQHYSAESSRSRGLPLMLYHSDRMYMSTGKSGTRVVMEFSSQAGERSVSG